MLCVGQLLFCFSILFCATTVIWVMWSHFDRGYSRKFNLEYHEYNNDFARSGVCSREHTIFVLLSAFWESWKRKKKTLLRSTSLKKHLGYGARAFDGIVSWPKASIEEKFVIGDEAEITVYWRGCSGLTGWLKLNRAWSILMNRSP